jgi:putative peptide zinc metalloprotease protein
MSSPALKAETSPADKKYVLKKVEIFPLESSSAESKYVVKPKNGRSYVISERLKDIILLFENGRTLAEAAEVLSAKEGRTVSLAQMEDIFTRFIRKYDLIDETGSNTAAGHAESHAHAERKKKSFEFVLKRDLIPPRLITPISSKLVWLYSPSVAVVAVAAIVFTHLAFLLNWFAPRPNIPFGAGDLVVYYGLMLLTVLVHELGHATACRAYRCDHGAVGALIYLIIPAFYINLSNIWRLPGKQRAVIDAGGIYFQLLTTIPLYLVYILTGSKHFAATIFAVDWMVLLSINPVLKLDGYWLLADLTGIVNLRKRAWEVAKETIYWAIGVTKGVPSLAGINGFGRKLLLVSYSFISFVLFTSLILLLLTFAPARAAALVEDLSKLAAWSEPSTVLLSLGRLLLGLVFFLFIYRLLDSTVFKLFKRSTWRKAG